MDGTEVRVNHLWVPVPLEYYTVWEDGVGVHASPWTVGVATIETAPDAADKGLTHQDWYKCDAVTALLGGKPATSRADMLQAAVDAVWKKGVVEKHERSVHARDAALQFRVHAHRGVSFLDVTRAWRSWSGSAALAVLEAEHFRGGMSSHDAFAPIASRGYLLLRFLGAGRVVPIFKAEALPEGATKRVEYTKEYGTGVLVTHTDADDGDHEDEDYDEEDFSLQGVGVWILDDLLATGGSIEAAAKLLKEQGAVVQGGIVVAAVPSLLPAALARLPFRVHVLVPPM